MEFETLKEDIREILNQYLDNIDAVDLKENEYVNDNDQISYVDGYNAIAILLQKGFREAMMRVYEDLPEDYYKDDENEEGHCCCHHGEHEEGHCCCHGESEEGHCCHCNNEEEEDFK